MAKNSDSKLEFWTRKLFENEQLTCHIKNSNHHNALIYDNAAEVNDEALVICVSNTTQIASIIAGILYRKGKKCTFRYLAKDVGIVDMPIKACSTTEQALDKVYEFLTKEFRE